MQLRIPVAIIIYLASYLPLSFILLTQDADNNAISSPICGDWFHFFSSCHIPLQHPAFALITLMVCMVCFIITLITLLLVKAKREIIIYEIKYIPAELINYSLPYIVSFMSLDFSDDRKFVGFLVFFLWIFFITYKSGQIIMNPVLAVFGWRLYEIKYQHVGGSDTRHNAVVLSRVPLETKNTFPYSTIQDVMIIKPLVRAL